MSVRAKKHLGQHFLNDESIAQRIAETLTGHGGYKNAVEIGPGMGVMTKYLLEDKRFTTTVIEIDSESVIYLEEHYPDLPIIPADFLKLDISHLVDTPYAIIGNFPYNISSQILFKMYDHRDIIPELTGMFQKEVAERIAEPPGTKKYGILSVLLQAFYDIEYLFTVEPEVFIPPPKVRSGVIRLKRNNVKSLDCDEKLFKVVVKTAFNQRRKMLRSSLKALLGNVDRTIEIFTERPEQLSVAQFVEITKLIEADRAVR